MYGECSAQFLVATSLLVLVQVAVLLQRLPGYRAHRRRKRQRTRRLGAPTVASSLRL